MDPIIFKIELETEPESLDEWDLIDQNEEEIMSMIVEKLARGGEDNDWNLLLDLCEILGRDFDDLKLKDDFGQHCDTMWSDCKRELLRDVAQDCTKVEVNSNQLFCTVDGSWE